MVVAIESAHTVGAYSMVTSWLSPGATANCSSVALMSLRPNVMPFTCSTSLPALPTLTLLVWVEAMGTLPKSTTSLAAVILGDSSVTSPASLWQSKALPSASLSSTLGARLYVPGSLPSFNANVHTSPLLPPSVASAVL